MPFGWPVVPDEYNIGDPFELVGNRRVRKYGRRFIEIADGVALAWPVHDQAQLHARALAQRLAGDREMRLRRDEHLRQAVVDDIGELARGQIGIDVGVIEPRALARDSAFDVTRVVLHEDGVVVASFQADGAQEMRDFVGARLQLSVGDRLAR